MAMLAEPRRKQKVINLRGGNKAWSEDTNKFGQKMLERMGWKNGKGLGAREDGIISHVVARFKNDERGLGYEERADQWTQHEDSFERLLANLAPGGENDKVAEPSGKSLEEMSKRSRARVHYHKFTRGKDLSRYSERDLANIFGKKTLNKQTNLAEPAEKTDKAELENCEITTEQMFRPGGSMMDYFNSKLKALGRSHLTEQSQEPSTDHSMTRQPEDNPLVESRSEPGVGKLKKKKKKQTSADREINAGHKFTSSNSTLDCFNSNQHLIASSEFDVEKGFSENLEPDEHKLKKKKKRQKEKVPCEQSEVSATTKDVLKLEKQERNEDCAIKKKKKLHEEVDLHTRSHTECDPETTSRKKKKKKKQTDA